MSISQRLCRICAFPAVDGGVPVDGEKLSEWSRRKRGIEIEQISDAVRPIVCQFCIWEARLDHENSIDDRSDNECEYDWWTGNDNDQNYEKYFYKKSLIQPCRVELKRLSRDVDHKKEKDSCKSSSCKAERKMQQNVSSNVNTVPDLKNNMIKTIYCATLSEGAEQMNKQVKQHHKGAIECEFSSKCHKFFLTENDMKKHIIRVHAPGIKSEVACIYCGNFFKNKYILSMHINYHHKGISFKCRFHGCKLFFLNQVDNDEHFRKVHNLRDSLKKFECPKCSFKTDSKYSLQNHILRKHSAAATVKCPKCGKEIKAKKYLQRHLKIVHGNRFDCEHCGKSMQKASLYAHFLGFKCKKMLTTCVDNTSYTQNSSNFLENNGHILQTSSQLTISDLPCIYCGKVYRHKRALVKHVKKVHAEIHIKCRLRGCTYYFISQAESDEHFSKLHQQEKSFKEYQCPKCSYKTCTKKYWKAHFLRRHCAVQKVKCQKCGKGLKNNATLRLHLRTIHGLRCTCEHCGKTMIKSSLHVHFLKNLCKKVPSSQCSPKVFKCVYDARCNKIFRSSFSMKRHVINVHKEIRKNVPCIYCGKVSTNEYSLAQHINGAHTSISFKCRFHGCMLYFLSQLESDEHFIKEHQLEDSLKKFQCPKCAYKTCTKIRLQIHFQRKHDAVKKVKCQKCGKELKNEFTLKQHLRTIHELRCTCEHCGKTMQKTSLHKHFSENLCNKVASLDCRPKVFKCECDYDARCTKIFCSSLSMKRHIINVHKEIRKNVPCIYCGKVSTNENSLASHIHNAHAEISFKCRFHGCKTYFLSQLESDEHFIKEHQLEDSMKQFQCPKCTYKTSIKKCLQLHLQKKHDAVKKVKFHEKCRKCGKELKNKSTLKHHIRTTHKLRCTCEHCGKTMQKDSLRKHFLEDLCRKGPNSTATLLKSAIFKCEHDARCTKIFHSSFLMKRHVIRAHKEKRKNLPCIYCGKVSTNENSLASHIRNAHSAISFKCRFHGCKLYFLSQAESDEHFSKEHQLEESLKNFECPKCRYKTNFKYILQTHFQMKHGVKKIKCQKCGKEFKTKESLKQHLNLVHYQERCVCEHCGATLKKSSLYHHLLGKRCKGGMFCNASQ